MSDSAAGEDAPLIEVRDLERIYHQGEVEVRALRGINLKVERGEFTALAGPSGSGKTTLLNMIGCLDDPSSGEVRIEGERVSGMSRTQAAEYRLGHIGFVFQAYNLIPVLTAWENAEFVLLMQGVSREERHAILDPLFERVGLAEYKDRKPHEMSGGQQQRVAVVRALGSRPRIVLADEPTANLDSATSASLLDLMLELNRERGVTFVFSTHDEMVIERARRVIRLDSGRVVADERDEGA
ncbi:ABC transporter ATP-binding protein [Lujinxingia vulgaris]|uniref:ABC transporter ATP-binding protein n=1 Tax=Lujinxingia vulgaris TaxID=2600176 RepID=A0A5C6X0P3_9DELT|nr:ABC transporter ATP-binding protein [Lujinxingia vulgaris]TXD34627.1 ABC transporter ATP-binding protein [Lujinxingia vulgaris]